MKQAVRRKHHYIYKITRVDGSGRYYIGMHSTDDLEDEYFGSGKLITRSIKKHGKEKHIKEILEYLPTREALKLREKEIVNEECIADKRCMNLKLGGEGGWPSVDLEVLRQRARKGGNSIGSKNIGYAQKAVSAEHRRAGLVTRIKNGNPFTTSGLKFSNDTKDKMSASATGSKNSQFGKCWVTKDGVSIKILKSELNTYVELGYATGRKMLIGNK